MRKIFVSCPSCSAGKVEVPFLIPNNMEYEEQDDGILFFVNPEIDAEWMDKYGFVPEEDDPTQVFYSFTDGDVGECNDCGSDYDRDAEGNILY